MSQNLFLRAFKTILVMNMGHAARAAEHTGSYFMCQVQDHTNNAGGGIVTCRIPMTLQVLRSQKDAEIILQRVPHYNHVKFTKTGSFVGKKGNFEVRGSHGAGYVTHTGIISFLATKVTVDISGFAVNVHQMGYSGAISGSDSRRAMDARSLSLTGGLMMMIFN